jgi:hypothetical protein
VAVGTPASPRPAPSVEPASPPSPDGPSPAPDAEPTAAPRPDATPELARDVPAPPSDARTAPRAPRAPRVTASRDVRASAEPAFVNVATPGGWADLYLRGAKVGRSPTRLTLPPGRHVIDLRPFGTQPPQRATVTAASGETARVSVPVHP